MSLLKCSCLQNLLCQPTNQSKITAHVATACTVIEGKDSVMLGAEGEFYRFPCMAWREKRWCDLFGILCCVASGVFQQEPAMTCKIIPLW